MKTENNLSQQEKDWSIVSEIVLVYRPALSPSKRPQIKDARESYQLLLTKWNRDTIELFEEFKIILLSSANRVLGICPISVGCVNGTMIDVRSIFGRALKANATRIILAHNHPSGNTEPSTTDRITTETIVKAGILLNLPVADHLIITINGFFSFADEGLI